MNRVDWTPAAGISHRFSVLVTEEMPVFLIASDSGLELAFKGALRSGDGIVYATRRSERPIIVNP